MDKNKLRKEISQLIDSIKEHSDMISNYQRIPQLELEMILSKIKKLYEKSIVFNYLNENEDDLLANKTSFQEQNIAAGNNGEDMIESKIDKMEGTQMQYVEGFDDEKEHGNIAKKEPLKNIQPMPNEVNAVIKEKTGSSSINEKISEKKEDSTIAGKLQKKPIESLNKAIGPNEKFIFIKELFKGDREAFNETIKHLDSLSDFEEAEKYIHKNIAGKYEWDFNLKSVVTFFDLVQRRYLQNTK